jgi:hypothetical protein
METQEHKKSGKQKESQKGRPAPRKPRANRTASNEARREKRRKAVAARSAERRLSIFQRGTANLPEGMPYAIGLAVSNRPTNKLARSIRRAIKRLQVVPGVQA